MNGRVLKWFMIALFSISALTGCFVHRDRDYRYYHDRDDRHHHDRDDRRYRD